MALKRSTLVVFIVLFLALFETQVLLGKSCSKPIQCGTNIKYHACEHKHCTNCTKTSDCSLNKGDTCHTSGYCEMEHLTSHFTLKQILAAVSVFIGSMIAAGGGLGGGGVFVPIFILIMGFDAKSAAALSQATIFGGSIVNLTLNFREQHPMRTHRTLADLATVLIFAPLLLGGAVMGVILNQIMPDPIIVILMIVILAYAAYRTFSKGIRLWKLENETKLNEMKSALYQKAQNDKQQQQQQQLQQQREQEQYRKQRQMDHHKTSPYESLHGSLAAMDSNESFDKPAANAIGDYTDINYNNNKNIEYPNMRANNSANIKGNNDGGYRMSISSGDNVRWVATVSKAAGVDSNYLESKLTQKELHELERLMKHESQIYQPMLYILLVWCIVCIFSLLRSTTVIIDLHCGSLAYWLVVVGIYPCLMVITAVIAKREVKSYQKKLSLYWMPCEGDIAWNMRRAITYPCIAMIAGLLGGLLGIGGGMIVSPLLFELGVLPRVAAATSAIAVMITASSSILQKYLEDMIRTDWMVFYIILGMVGTFAGQTVINYFVKKYNRTSLIVFAVATIIGLAVVLMGIDGFVDMDWNFEFVSLC